MAGLLSSARADDAPLERQVETAQDGEAKSDAEWFAAAVKARGLRKGEELFDQYLFRTAERLDAYFTIERVANRRRALTAFFYLHASTTNPRSVEEWVCQLDALKGIKAVRNASRPNVVHLIEESLLDGESYPLEGEGYPMERRVTGSFSGVLMDLPDRLGRLTPGVTTAKGTPIGGFGVLGDYETKVEVTFKNDPVRDVLTDAVPVEGYMRQLWEAETNRWERGRLQTRVKFYGPKSSYETADPPAESGRPEP